MGKLAPPSPRPAFLASYARRVKIGWWVENLHNPPYKKVKRADPIGPIHFVTLLRVMNKKRCH